MADHGNRHPRAVDGFGDEKSNECLEKEGEFLDHHSTAHGNSSKSESENTSAVETTSTSDLSPSDLYNPTAPKSFASESAFEANVSADTRIMEFMDLFTIGKDRYLIHNEHKDHITESINALSSAFRILEEIGTDKITPELYTDANLFFGKSLLRSAGLSLSDEVAMVVEAAGGSGNLDNKLDKNNSARSMSASALGKNLWHSARNAFKMANFALRKQIELQGESASGTGQSTGQELQNKLDETEAFLQILGQVDD